MTAIMAGSLGGEDPPIRMNGLSIMSIVTNATCNLQCRHCYLAPEGPAIAVRSENWLRYLKSVFVDLQPHSLCFSGKEVFALEETASLFFDALQLRDDLQTDISRRTHVGTITNATLVERYRDRLASCSLDWLDVSIDGLEQTHDRIRGKGAFARMACNLPWLIDALGDRLWIAVTLMEDNIESLPDVVSVLNQTYGVKRFTIGQYKPLVYTDSAIRIHDLSRHSRILRSLNALRQIDLTTDVRVRFEFDADDKILRKRLEDECLIPGLGVLRASTHQFDNGLALQFTTVAIPVGLWRSVRVTNEGLVVAAEDLVDATAYRQRAVANIAEFGYDARRIYAAGLSHPRFRELHGVPAELFFDELARSA